MKNQLCRWGSGDGNIRKSAVPHAQERRSQRDDINGSKLQILNSELMAAREENEGATYRLEELDWIISDEMAPRLAARYHQLRSEFSERMDQASTIMLHTGFRIQNQMHQLGIKLENAEITAKQEALAVGSADRLCALHVEMLEVVNQHQSLKNSISLSIRNWVGVCGHQARWNHGGTWPLKEVQMQEVVAMKMMGLRSELFMRQSFFEGVQHQLTESRINTTRCPVDAALRHHHLWRANW